MLVCDHIALVVREIEPVLGRLDGIGIAVGPIEEFPDEGTREVYLGDDTQAGRLLLMQPLGGDGPYAHALAKRGPGLHHVAVAVLDARDFVRTHPGWLVHPESLDAFEASRTLWLARPGVGTLVEVQEIEAGPSGPALVERVEIPVTDPAHAALVTGLAGTTEMGVGGAGAAVLTLGERVLQIPELTA